MTKPPEGYFFTEKHEWAREEGGELTIGISDFAQESLGDVVYVDLKPPGTVLTAGDSFGAIESVKAAEDLYCPVGGTIEAQNAALNDDPAAVNQDAHGSWMIKLKDYNKEDLQKLMDAAAYASYLEDLAE